LETQTNRQMNQMSDGPRPGFTPKQGQYLAFIDAYTRVHRRPPAEREMQRHFGVTPPSVHQMILTLERAAFIRRQPGAPRSIEVLVPPEDLPVLQANFQPFKTSVTRY
jgi:DNA-binding MarR family transcriptional regulator